MKSRKMTRLLALLLAMVMCVSMAACGNEKPQDNQGDVAADVKPNTGENTEESSKNYWEMLDEVTDSSQLPDWTGEKLEINVWRAEGTDRVFGELSDTNVTFKEIERVTGIVINAEESFANGGETIDAKLPKLLATNDFPTMIIGYNIGEQMNELYENGYLYDLTEYYDNGTLDHLQYWLPVDQMEDQLYHELRAEDGSLFMLPVVVNAHTMHQIAGYSVPEIDNEYFNIYGKAPQNKGEMASTTCLYVRDDVLQAVRPGAASAAELKAHYIENGTFSEDQIFDLGLKTTEDFVQLMYDIQAELATGKYVGLDGRPMEVTYGPSSETDNWPWMVQLAPAISGYAGDYFTILSQENSKNGTMFEWGFKNEYVLDHMKLLNGLVRDDVISQNSLVDNSALFEEKVNNGHYAVTYGRNPAAVGQGQADWGYRPIWIDSTYNKTYSFSGGAGTNTYAAIFKSTVTEEQLDQLMHYVDYINSMVGINMLFWGPESAGLFTYDENGNRMYTDPELEACMLYKEDNGANVKYGLMNPDVAQRTFNEAFPLGPWEQLFKPSYTMKSSLERQESDAFIYFNPGTISGKSLTDVAVRVNDIGKMYSTGLQVPAIGEFWTARAGFENQMKKVIAAESDAEYEAQLQALWEYAEEFGLTDEALKEYNELIIGLNYQKYKDAGFKVD